MAKEIEIRIRDKEIIADLRNGMTGREAARKYNLSAARISQIAKGSLDTEAPLEELRDWLVQGYLGDLAILGEIARGPGRPITSGKGDHVIDAVTDLPAYDPSPRIDAVRTAGQVRKNVAMLQGAEKPVPKPLEESADFSEAIEIMQDAVRRSNLLEKENESLRLRLSALENRDVHEADVVELDEPPALLEFQVALD